MTECELMFQSSSLPGDGAVATEEIGIGDLVGGDDA